MERTKMSMNYRKMILALAINVALLLSLLLFAKSGPVAPNERDFRGCWQTAYNAEQFVEMSLAQLLGVECQVEEGLEIYYVFDFKDDGTMTIYIEEDSVRRVVEAQTKAMRQVLPELLYQQFQQIDGLSREEVDGLLEAEGMTMEMLVEISIANQDMESLLNLGSTAVTKYYCVQDGKLCFAASREELSRGHFDLTVEPEFKGRTLVLSNAKDSQGNAFEGSGPITYPVTLTKK